MDNPLKSANIASTKGSSGTVVNADLETVNTMQEEASVSSETARLLSRQKL